MEIKRFIDYAQVKADISINPSDFDDAVIRQADLFVHYARCAIDAQRQAERLKAHLKDIEGRVYREKREEMEGWGKKPTEPQLKAQVDEDGRVKRVRVLLGDAEAHADECKYIVESFRHRRDMIVQYSKHQLEERKGEMRIQSRDEELDAAKDRAREILKGSGFRQ